MNSTIKIILVSSVSTISILLLYHLLFNRAQIIEIEDNFGKMVAERQITIPQNDDEIYSTDIPNDFILPANRARYGVVAIKAVKIKGNGWMNQKYSKTNGSGVILSSNGYIVTNFHVVEDADKIQATLENKREYDCKVIGTDRSTDLALLKIDADQLQYLEFGDSDSLNIGEWVLAVGNPFKLTSSVTAGIVSAKGREINIFDRQGIESFIQTDAAINPGSSGGALINTKGQLMGINTAILTYSGKYEGFSFAVPSNIVRKVVNDLREFGTVQRAWLGIGIMDINDKTAKELNLNYVAGVLVDLVEKDGAAKEAGVESGDIIISMGGKSTPTEAVFVELISQYSPGDEVDLVIMRNGKKLIKNVILRNQLNTTDFIGVRKDKVLTELGFELRDLAKKEIDRLSTDGVMVVSIMKDSKIFKTNMDPGFVITSFNNQSINSVTELVEAFQSYSGQVVLKGIYENYPGEYPYEFYK